MARGDGEKRLHLKIRLVLTRPMSRRRAVALVERAMRTRRVPEGIELAWIDWGKEDDSGSIKREGEFLDDDAHDALVDFYAAITHPDTSTRVEIVGEE